MNTVLVHKFRAERHAHRRQRGAAAVEFALVLPLLLTLVMGAIDWGWFFYIDQLVTNAAREGARAGSLTAPPPTGTSSAAVATAKQASQDFLTKVNLNQAGTVAASMTTVTGSNGVAVVITYPVGSITGFLPTGLVPTNATATSVMRWP